MLSFEKQDEDVPQNIESAIIACLKRVQKSIPRWTRRGGRQGYLSFVSQFIP